MKTKDTIVMIIGIATFLATIFPENFREFIFSLSWEYYAAPLGILLILYSILCIIIRHEFKINFKDNIQTYKAEFENNIQTYKAEFENNIQTYKAEFENNIQSYKKEINSLECKIKEVKEDFSNKTKQNEKKLNELKETNELLKNSMLNRTKINKALCLEGFIYNYIESAQNEKELDGFARFLISLYERHYITLADWKKYNIPKELYIRMNKVLHEYEAKKNDKELKKQDS